MKCQTGVLACVLVVSLVLLAESHAADPPKSAFGEAFDEIVVESTLTVRGKGPSRQSRNKSLTLPKKATAATSTTKPQEASTAEPEKRTRREISHINLPRDSVHPHNGVFQVVDLFRRDLYGLGPKRP